MRVTPISVIDVEYVAYTLAREMAGWTEPIPAFGTRFPGVLEHCVDAPFQKFGGKDLYPGLVRKSAVLFYLMIKNHPFQNGNKRIAMTTTLYFLYKNSKWLNVDNQELYNFAKWVAESNPKLKEQTVGAAEAFFKVYLADHIQG